MIFKKKVLSVLLACFMISTLFCAITASADVELQKILELNLDNFVGDMDKGENASSCGIEKEVDAWGGTVLDIHGKPQDASQEKAKWVAASTISKEFATNLDGEAATPVIKFENNVPTWSFNSTNFRISNIKFESEDNTITFWANTTVGSENAGIFDYRAEKDGTNTDVKTLWEFDAQLSDAGDVLINNSASNKVATIETGWNHFAIVNHKAAGGTKVMELYVNGSKVYSQNLDTSNASSLKNATIAFAGKWAANGNNVYGYNDYLAKSAMYGNIEVYRGALSEDEVYRVYYDSQADYGFTSPNLVTGGPDEVKPDDESITVTMLNNVDKNDVKEILLIEKETGNEIPSSFSISGNKVAVTPKDYLKYGKDYKIDFPAGYCGDFNFTTVVAPVRIESISNTKGTNFVNLNLINEDNTDVAVVILGYDEEGFVTVASMQDYDSSLTVPGIGNCKTIKVFIWGKDGDKLVPLTDVSVIEH